MSYKESDYIKSYQQEISCIDEFNFPLDTWIGGRLSYDPGQHTEAEGGGVPYPAIPSKYQSIIKYEICGSEEAKEVCGEFYTMVVCESCDYERPIKKSCNNPRCPICWVNWASREASKVGERINGFKIAWKEVKGRRIGNVKEIIFSPPQEVDIGSIEAIRKLKSECIKKAKEIGLKGGNIIFHPYRLKERAKEVLKGEQLINRREDGRTKGFWELVIEHIQRGERLSDYAYNSPHLHILGFGKIVEKSSDFYKRSGWVYKFKKHLNKAEEIEGLTFYLLSHTAIVKGLHAVSWWGSLSYNKLIEAKDYREEEMQPAKCPKCGGDLKLVAVDTGFTTPYFVKVVYKVWYMKDDPPPYIKVP